VRCVHGTGARVWSHLVATGRDWSHDRKSGSKTGDAQPASGRLGPVRTPEARGAKGHPARLARPPSAEQTFVCFGCFERCSETMIRNTDTEQSRVSA
jgi:hypothetical protein